MSANCDFFLPMSKEYWAIAINIFPGSHKIAGEVIQVDRILPKPIREAWEGSGPWPLLPETRRGRGVPERNLEPYTSKLVSSCYLPWSPPFFIPSHSTAPCDPLEGHRGVNILTRAKTRWMSNILFPCRFLPVIRPKMEAKTCDISVQ